MASALRNERTINPDTGSPETEFREQVREALGLTWDVRDAAIIAELKRLKSLDDEDGYGHGV